MRLIVYRVNEEYDPLTDSWSIKAPMAQPRYNFDATTLNGKVYALGSTYTKDFEEYDPVTDTWTYKPDMASPCNYNEAVTVSGKIYNFGWDMVQEYDPGRETYFYIHRKD